MTAIISLKGKELLRTLDEHGWVQQKWTGPHGEICAHQAIRLCAPQPGDASLVEQVSQHLWGRGPGWNDSIDTTEDDVRAWLAAGVEVTDADLEQTFGPCWERVVAVARQAAQLTSEQAEQLAAAWAVEKDATWAAARTAAWAAARDVAWDAARDVAWAAARDVAWDAAEVAARAAAEDAAWDAWIAAGAAVTWDLAAEDGPYTIEMRDLLYAPWRQAFGELI